MKKEVLLLLILFSICFVSATQTYLNESYPWQNNLTKIYMSALAWGDLDNDGDLDLIATGVGGIDYYISKIYINNGTSLVENSIWQENLTAVSYGSLALGDIDNDGDLDLALSGCEGQASYVGGCPSGENITTLIYINNGSTLTESSQWQGNLTEVYRSALAFTDVDNDGKLDLVLTGQTETTYLSKIYINDGTSLVESSQWQSNLTPIRQSGLAFGDIDNDNDLDLILSGQDLSPAKRTTAYLNNGTSFVESSQWGDSLTDVSDSSVTFADFDNDGDLDLSLAGCCDEHRIYRNNGTAFVEINREVTGGLDGFFAGSVAFGDYDTDGYLDLITSGREDGTFLYLYNISANNFTDYSQDPESHITNIIYGSLAWLDLDNDYDLDLIEIGYDNGILDVEAFIYLSNRSLTKNNTIPTPPNTFSSSYTNNVLTLVWNNGSDAETTSTGLYYNLMVGNSTTNHTVVSGVYGGSSNPTAGYFGNMMQRKNITLNLELEASETYYWYVQTIDTGLAKSEWSARQSFSTGADVTKPSVTLNPSSPSAGVHTTDPYFVFNASIIDANMKNVTLYANWNGTWHVNETDISGVTANYTFEKNLTNLDDNMYSWYIYACDDSSNCKSSATRTFYLDRTYPLVNSISPTDANSWTSSSTVTFSYNVTDTDIANCSLIISGSIDQTDSSITENTTQTFTKTMSNGAYNWNINCTDYVSYTNSSTIRSLTVSYTAPPSSSSGGGGSSTTTPPTIVTPEPEQELFDIDFFTSSSGAFESQQGDIKTFSFNSQTTHKITILEVTNTSAKIIIESEPIILILNIGETKQIDINSDGMNDFEINLVSIINGKANFSLTKLEGADIVAQEELDEAIRKQALFDVKVEVVNFFEVVKAGRDVIAEIEAFNVNNIGQVDIGVNYYLTDEDNQTKLSEGSDTLAVEAVTSFVRSLAVPLTSKSGKYFFHVDITYQDKLMASGSAEFRVIKNYEIIIIIGIVVLVIVSIFVYLWRIKKRGERLERKEAVLEKIVRGLKRGKKKK